MNTKEIRWQQRFQNFETAFHILHGTIDRSLAVTGQYLPRDLTFAAARFHFCPVKSTSATADIRFRDPEWHPAPAGAHSCTGNGLLLQQKPVPVVPNRLWLQQNMVSAPTIDFCCSRTRFP